MSMQTLLRDMAVDLRLCLNNRDIKAKDIEAWGTSQAAPTDDTEVVFQIPNEPGYRYCGLWVTVKKTKDKRNA